MNLLLFKRICRGCDLDNSKAKEIIQIVVEINETYVLVEVSIYIKLRVLTIYIKYLFYLVIKI